MVGFHFAAFLPLPGRQKKYPPRGDHLCKLGSFFEVKCEQVSRFVKASCARLPICYPARSCSAPPQGAIAFIWTTGYPVVGQGKASFCPYGLWV
jgi:hypothetical protein